MRKLKSAFLLMFFTILNYSTLPQTQEKFIVGADWLNPHNRNWFFLDLQPITPAYWDTISSFGLNYGMLTFKETALSGTQGEEFINAELDKAAAENLTIFLNNYKLNNSNIRNSRRWVYQVEDTYDYNQHSGGYSEPDANADIHWTQIHNEQVDNYWKLTTIEHNAGLIAHDLKDGLDTEIPDGSTYYVKVRVKVPQGTPSGSNIVFRVIVKNEVTGLTKTKDVTRNQITTSWQELDIGLSFKKTPEGPEVVGKGEEDLTNVTFVDTIGLLGVEDYDYDDPLTFTQYDFQIYWFDNYNCDFDYIAVEDYQSNQLHTGQLDYLITQTVENYMENDGLGNIKVAEEPWQEFFYPIRYTDDLIEQTFLQNQLEVKYSLGFHRGGSDGIHPEIETQEYLGKTLFKQHLANIYPIGNIIEPDPTSAYTNTIQDRFDNVLLWRFDDHINGSQRFNRPYWFTVQAHSWTEGGQMRLREPSAYEISAMANLSISYGATGIYYFMYSIPRPNADPLLEPYGVTLLDDDLSPNPLPRYWDNYGYPKWQTLKDLNFHLRNIGSELLALDWEESLYINGATQPQGTYISSVESIQDAAANTHIQLGFFKWADDPNNDNLEHFFVVNRRTYIDDERDIKITIDKSGSVFSNWIVKEVGTNNSWTVYKTGYFQTSYEPGEGKLFRLEPVVMGGGNLIYNETINSDIDLNGDLIIENGVTLTVNANYHCYGNITLNGGNIFGGGKIFFHDNKRIIVGGTSQILGSSGTIELDFIAPHTMNGIQVMQGANFRAHNCIVRNARNGITVQSNAVYFRASLVQFYACSDYGINIYGPISLTPTISLCQFNNSSFGLGANNLSEILVQFNQFINNDIGINLINVAVPHISDNTISSNKKTLPGIFLESCNGEIRNNLISGHTNGIHLGNSSPDIGGNEITDNLYHGIYIGTGSLPNIEASLYSNPPVYYALSGYNNIFENGGTTTGGPTDNDGSEIYFSFSNALMQAGCNSICDDRSPGGEHPPYNTQLLMNCTGFGFPIVIHAEQNFWCDNPLYPLEDRFGNLIVYYEPVLVEPCTISNGGGEELFVKSSSGEIIDTLYPVPRTIGTLSNTELLYASAEEKFITADYGDAEELYNQVVNGNDSLVVKLLAHKRLYEIGKLNSKPTSYFNNLYSVYSSISQSTEDSLIVKIFTQLSSLSLIGEEEIIPAVEEFDNVVQQNPGNEESVYAEIDALTAALLIENGDSTLGKSAAANYIADNNEYNKRVISILRKHFGAESDEKEKDLLPTEYTLYQNYPNPFNPVTTIKYYLPKAGNVELEVYDILGRRVKTLVSQTQQAGSYEISFDAGEFASGIYIYQLKADNFINSKKMILLK